MKKKKNKEKTRKKKLKAADKIVLKNKMALTGEARTIQIDMTVWTVLKKVEVPTLERLIAIIFRKPVYCRHEFYYHFVHQ